MRRPTETKSLKVVLRCGWSVSVYLENVKFLAATLAFTHAKYGKTVTAVTVAANGPRGCGSRFFCSALTKVGGFDAVEKRRSLPNKVAENTEVRRLKYRESPRQQVAQMSGSEFGRYVESASITVR